jgi:hypothetical protein
MNTLKTCKMCKQEKDVTEFVYRRLKTFESVRCQTCREKLWKPGMTWNNWARKGWHIDHIKPLSSFDLENREELLQACHHTNLQPLWWFENLEKGRN